MSAFSSAAFSEQAYSLDAFDFGDVNVSFSSAAFSKDVALSSSAFSFDGGITTTLRPGRVYRGTYPHWKPLQRKPYWEDPNQDDEEKLLAMMGIFLD